MKKEMKKASGIATVCAWGGIKDFVIGPAEIVFHARADKENNILGVKGAVPGPNKGIVSVEGKN